MNRRQLLKFTATFLGAVLVAPQMVLAFARKGFDAKGMKPSIKEAFGSSSASNSKDVSLTAPEIAENGAVVPVTVRSTLPNVEAIAIFVESNPSPLAASFPVLKGMKAEVSTRVKMRGTSKVTAIVKSNGKLYSATREVKVTLGGCGG